jgi:uncharacterized LabA/DUF88 family protein
MPTIAIFVDVQNIYYTTKATYQRPFNYRKFWQHINQTGTIAHAYAYATDRGDSGQAKFQSALKHIGFEVKLKPFIQRADGSAKGDWDVGITMDIMKTAPSVDKVILLSGDGDFAILLNGIRDMYQTKTAVYSVEKLTAKALIDACDTYRPICELDLL